MGLESTVDDLIHTDPFFSSQEVTEGKCSPEGHLSEDEAVKWLDQFIVWLKFFVKRKIKRGVTPPSWVRLNWGGLPSETLESGSLEKGESAGFTEGAALRVSAP